MSSDFLKKALESGDVEKFSGFYLLYDMDTLALAYGTEGELEIFALDDEGALNHICDKSTDGTWGYWTSLGGSLQGRFGGRWLGVAYISASPQFRLGRLVKPWP